AACPSSSPTTTNWRPCKRARPAASAVGASWSSHAGAFGPLTDGLQWAMLGPAVHDVVIYGTPDEGRVDGYRSVPPGAFWPGRLRRLGGVSRPCHTETRRARR